MMVLCDLILCISHVLRSDIFLPDAHIFVFVAVVWFAVHLSVSRDTNRDILFMTMTCFSL